MTGLVKRYDPDRGWGLIQPLIGAPGADLVFYHFTALPRLEDGSRVEPPVGAEVSFLLVRGEKGPQAAAVRLRKISGRELRRKEN
jgi:cold shock CspA family protein